MGKCLYSVKRQLILKFLDVKFFPKEWLKHFQWTSIETPGVYRAWILYISFMRLKDQKDILGIGIYELNKWITQLLHNNFSRVDWVWLGPILVHCMTKNSQQLSTTTLHNFIPSWNDLQPCPMVVKYLYSNSCMILCSLYLQRNIV